MSGRLSRRAALARMAAMTSTLPLLGCVYPGAPDAAVANAPWPELDLAPLEVPGYGTDPVLIAPAPAPWPRTLSAQQLALVDALGEHLCPGASTARVADVIDEWVSAPYPSQQADRALLLPGFAWLDADCVARHGAAFATLSADQRDNVCSTLAAQDDEADTPQHNFFRRFRTLVAGAFFSSPAGVAELGYQGNTPIAGPSPGPTPAAMDHLNKLLDELGLGD